MSFITHGELRYGALRSQHKQLALTKLDELIALIPVVPAHLELADYYAKIRADLAAKGTPIGNNDLWIAAHVCAEKKILVSNNLKEFQRVKTLKCENWIS